MVRLRSPAPYGGFPEWPKGTDCKSAALLLRWSESTIPHQQKNVFCLPDKRRFFERCVPRAERDGVMRPSDVMCASRVKGTLTEHIISLCGEAVKHHYGEAITSLARQGKHHFFPGNRQQSEVEGFFAKPVEKFTKLCYNDLDKSEFAGE